MLQALAEAILATGLQAIGWGVFKIVTFGRYRGFQPEDVLTEGAVGFAVIAAICVGLYAAIT